MPLNFENRSTNKDLTPKIDLDLGFCMCKGGNLKFINTDSGGSGHLDNSKLSELNSSVERIYFCPICDQATELETISCEQCDEWYHYSCAGITEKDIKKIGKDIPFIYECCSDNVLYGTQLEDTSKLTELGSNEKNAKNKNNTSISSSSIKRK